MTASRVDHSAICRLCTAYCPLLVTVEDGAVTTIKGNPDAGFHGGYSCPKGRAMAEQHYGSARLLTSMKADEGCHVPISSGAAMDEIAEKITRIIAEHGPRSVALYGGFGQVAQFSGGMVAAAWMNAIGSRMSFSAGSIDKPGIMIALALHGDWQGGQAAFTEADGWLIVGANPVISKGPGFPAQNPGRLLKDAVGTGVQLIVIDPRLTETAKRASIHLQPLPGNDSAILAAMINVVIAEALYDAAFVAENVEGFEGLAAATAPFTPSAVAQRAGVAEVDLIAAARTFAGSKIAGVTCGTGASFAGHSTLTEYLGLCLTSLCGQWVRAGEPVRKPNVLLPAYVAKAQPYKPFPAWGFGEQLRVRGLGGCASGLAATALAEEILMEGEGQVRALICVAGNPMMSFPDQIRTFEALKSLELLVTIDFEMTATARLADYVIAPKLTLETPATTALVEKLKYIGTHRGMDRPYAQYVPALVDPPAGSDLIEEWEFFYGLAQRMGLGLHVVGGYGSGQHVEHPPTRFDLDMQNKPTSDELIESILQDSRIPLSDVKQYPNGRIYDEIDERVQPRDPGNTDRLQLADATMMAELGDILEEWTVGPDHSADYPFLLVSRRINNVINSTGRTNTQLLKKAYNPLSMNPDDLASVGLTSGDHVRIRSRHGEVSGLVEVDPTLRSGVVSMTQGFGGLPGEDDDPLAMGANTGRLLSVEDKFDPVTGIPLMGALPVVIERLVVEMALA